MTTWVSEDQKHTGRAVAVENSFTVWLDEPWTTVVARRGAEKIRLAPSCSCGWHADEDEIGMNDSYALVMRRAANGRTSVSRALSEREPRSEWEEHVQDKAQDDAWGKLGDASRHLHKGWDGVNEQDPMDRLRICRSFRHWWLEETERSAVIEARRAGRTWEQIGTALGVSRQAVHERYRSYTDDLSSDLCAAVMVDDDSDTDAEPGRPDPATMSQLDRAEHVEQVRTALREWNGYDPSPEEEAEADARLNAMVGRAPA